MKLLFLLLFTSFAKLSSGQTIDSLISSDSEIPPGYSKSSQLICVTPHAFSFYEQVSLYEAFLGKVKRKAFQSFEKKGDKGSILYFEFEKPFEGEAFLQGLLWGGSSKPAKSEPDDFYSKGNILVIWSFNLKSEIREVSKAKVVKRVTS